ncbi:phospholipase [candidate division KSB1 bacterium]|nr:phospholipase [candidate division KSB1 bacterium]
MARKKAKRTGVWKSLALLLAIIIAVSGLYYYRTGDNPVDLLRESKDLNEFLTTAKERILHPEPPKAPPTTTVAEGDWWNVYFTNPMQTDDPASGRNSIQEKLIHHIQNSNKSIHIASFEFNLTPVAEALIEAHHRGVEVLWVTDNEHGLEADHETGHGQFAMLQEAGIPVKDDARGALMHNKFWIFDGEIVWTGSTNITQNGIFKNNNNVITIKSPELAMIYEAEFQEMWQGNEFGITSTSTPDRQKIAINGNDIQVFFAAEDDVAEKLLPIIESAQNSIRFMAFSFTHNGMGDAILNRARAGIDVKGIFELRGSETSYSELGKLHRAGVPVRQDGNPRTFHHKVIIIDNKTVVTGSFNFSNNANKNNDENVIVINNRDISQQYTNEFERRWEEAQVPDL